MDLLTSPSNSSAPRLDVSTPLADLQAAASSAAELVLVFSAFRDGRGFSAAAALRAQGFAGRLVAAGHVLPDQVRHLERSGFDAVEIGEGEAEVWNRAGAVISTVYPRQSPRDRRPPRRDSVDLDEIASILNARYDGADAATVVRAALAPAWGLQGAVLSSFGAEAAVLLDVVAGVDPALPVLFLDTGQHFLQTLGYRKALSERLKLSDVRIVRPDADEAGSEDPRETLWKSDPDACCDLRKRRPLARAAAGFNLLLTGRKRHHQGARQALPIAEVIDGSLRLNPLATWDTEAVEAWFARRDLPAHPLIEQGYPSIGCWPCTRPADPGAGVRSGRWADSEKTECGIHLGSRTRTAEEKIPGMAVG